MSKYFQGLKNYFQKDEETTGHTTNQKKIPVSNANVSSNNNNNSNTSSSNSAKVRRMNSNGAATPSRSNSKFGSTGSSSKTNPIEHSTDSKILMVMMNAAQCLADSIQEISSDTIGLTGDSISGFERLVTVMVSSDYSEDPVEISRSYGIGCLQILLNHMDHPLFIETCNQAGLATALVHALRLIRMFEIKINKTNTMHPTNLSTPPSQYSATFDASLRLCRILSKLCSNLQTIEQLRPSLVKLLTFPLSILPPEGLHIQEHSASIISAMCKTGFSSQQVWYLHDAQAIIHMIRHMHEMTLIIEDTSNSPTKQKSKDLNTFIEQPMLRGITAEKAGMWLIGCRCIVEVISSTIVVSPVLLSDFEAGGGIGLFVHILKHTSQELFMKTVNCMSKLLFDQSKLPDDSSNFTVVGTIFSELLLSTLKLKRPIVKEDNMDRLIEIAHNISHIVNNIGGKEFIPQSLAYTLLTIYSNDTSLCAVLEEKFQFLPTLIVCLPAISSFDASSAILTTLNYVSQCVESSASMSLIALSAATCVLIEKIVNKAIAMNIRKNALQQLDVISVSYESIIRGSSKFCIQLLNNGLLHNVFYSPFERLNELVGILTDDFENQVHVEDLAVDNISSHAFEKIISLMVVVIQRNPSAADEIRNCGLNLIFKNLIRSPLINCEFCTKLLSLYHSLARSERSHLEESLAALFEILKLSRTSFNEKQRVLLESLAKILLYEGAASICIGMGGLDDLLEILLNMKDKFRLIDTQLNDASTQTNVDSLTNSLVTASFSCLHAFFKVISAILIFTSNPFYSKDAIRFDKNYYVKLAHALLQTGIFTSEFCEKAIELLFDLYRGFSNHSMIVNPTAIEIVIELLPTIEFKLSVVVVNKLIEFAKGSDMNKRLMNEARTLQLLIRKYNFLFDPSEKVDSPISDTEQAVAILPILFRLIEELAFSYLTLDSFVCFVQSLIRPNILSDVETSNYKLLLPWISYETSNESKTWNGVKFLVDLCDFQLVNKYDSVPCIYIGRDANIGAESINSIRSSSTDGYFDHGLWYPFGEKPPTYLSVIFNDPNKPFPHSCFSFSSWYQISTTSNSNPEQDKNRSSSLIPLMTICSGGNVSVGSAEINNRCFFEVHVDHESNLIKILSSKAGKITATLQFKPQKNFVRNEWNLVTIMFRKQKRFASNATTKGSVLVYVNGLNCPPVNSDLIDLELVPAPNQSVEMTIGLSYLMHLLSNGPTPHLQSQIQMLNSSKSPVDNVNYFDNRKSYLAAPQDKLASLWKLGPVMLYDEILSPSQIVCIYVKGPRYSGTFHCESPLSDYLPTLCSDLLLKCTQHSGTKSVENFVDSLGLKGLEAVVDPRIESNSDMITTFNFPLLPIAILVLSAKSNSQCPSSNETKLINTPGQIESSFYLEQPDPKGTYSNSLKGFPRKSLLLNSAVYDTYIPTASLENSNGIPSNMSIGDCISALGGPEFLLPIFQAASNELQICQAAVLLKHSIRNNLSNLKYMQTVGYKILGFILSGKPNQHISTLAIDALFELSITKVGNEKAKDGSWYILLTETASIYFLMLNHQIWSPHRYEIACDVIVKLLRLVSDDRYGLLNSKKLSNLACTRWILMLCIFGIEFSPQTQLLTLPINWKTNDPLNKLEVSPTEDAAIIETTDKSWWKNRYFNAVAMADERDDPDFFLSKAIEAVQMIMISEIRKKDLELITKLVLYTFINHQRAHIDSNLSTCVSQQTAFDTTSNSDVQRLHPFCNYETPNFENVVRPMDVFRVYLLRLIFQLYDEYSDFRYHSKRASTGPNMDGRKSVVTSVEGDLLNLFRVTFSYTWVWGVLEKSSDVATKSHCLRLLSIFLQKDSTYRRDFATNDGIKVLYPILLTNADDLSVSLPLIAILFRIPSQLLSHPFKIKSVQKFCQIIDLEECPGPDISEPVLSGITLPTLSLLMDIVTTASRNNLKYGRTASPVTQIIIGIILYAIDSNPHFRLLMQEKAAIEIISSSMLNVSNAYSDFEAQIYEDSTGETVSDLSTMVQEDYLVDKITPSLAFQNNTFNETQQDSSEFETYANDSTISNETSNSADILNIKMKQNIVALNRWNRRVSKIRTIQETEISCGSGSMTNDARMEIKILTEDGFKILGMMEKLIQMAIEEYDNYNILCHLIISYPKALSGSYEFGYQSVIIKTFCLVVDKQVIKSADAKFFKNVSQTVTFLVPLVRANIIYDHVQFELLTLLLRSFSRICTPVAVTSESIQDVTKRYIRELGHCCRFLSVSCLNIFSMLGKNDAADKFRLEVISTIRSNLKILLHPSLEDSIDNFGSISAPSGNIISNKFTSRNTLAENTSTTDGTYGKERESFIGIQLTSPAGTVLDAIQQGMNVTSSMRKTNPVANTQSGNTMNSNFSLGQNAASSVNSTHHLWSSVRTDRNRVSYAFCAFLINHCYSLVLDDNTSVRIEATRIIAILAANRKQLLEQLLGSTQNNNSKTNETNTTRSSKDIDIFRDGLMKLVPNSSGKYEIFLKGGTDDNESEENRFADFSFWVSDNSVKCDRIFNAVENSLHFITPSSSEVDEVIKYSLSNRFKDSIQYSNSAAANNVIVKMERAEEGQRQGETIRLILRRWNLHGLAYLANGAMHWRSVWLSLQSNPIWGYRPLKSSQKKNEPLVDDMNTIEDSALWESKNWYLDPSEGPERARRKLEQDFSIPVPALTRKGLKYFLSPKRRTQSMEYIDKIEGTFSVDKGSSEVSTPVKPILNAETSSKFNESHSTFGKANELIESSSSKQSHKFENILSGIFGSQDMEEFLKHVVTKGVIKRVKSAAYQEKDDDNDMNLTGDDKSSRVETEDNYTSSSITTEKSAKKAVNRNLSVDYQDADEDDFVITNEKETTDITPNQEKRLKATTSMMYFSADAEENNLTELLQDAVDEPKPVRSVTRIDEKSTNLSHPVESVVTSNKRTSSNPDQILEENVYRTNTKDIPDLVTKYQQTKSTLLQEIIRGFLGTSEWNNGSVYNIKRICGLEAQTAVLVMTLKNIYVLSGFKVVNNPIQLVTAMGPTRNSDLILDWEPTVFVVGNESTTHPLLSSIKDGDHQVGNQLLFSVLQSMDHNDNLSYGQGMNQDPSVFISQVWQELLCSDLGYFKMPLEEVYSFFKRRYQLKYTAMEVTDVKGYSILFSCDSSAEMEDILIKLLEADLPLSVFNSIRGLKNLQLLRGASIVYRRLMETFVSSITNLWLQGEISNFEYLMHINSAAGRSFQDLTQYPVFPWILADYSSDDLDLEDPKKFRDLSKPMGSLGAKRLQQYADRYQTMSEFNREGVKGSSPPFHYGTHYSCAGYVLHYLVRLQPYANMSIALQGGTFDKADRLFLSVENSWLSASQENLQDVRELIPEFYYLPEFLINHNGFDLGITQKDELVNDVALPKWSHNDPREFIKLHREALESRYVSENLHNWMDLIFGYKQRGRYAEEAINVFIHLTYEGEVDVDAIDDPVMRNATISQINNFGQTPSKLFKHAHPKKIVKEIPKRLYDPVPIESQSLVWHNNCQSPIWMIGTSLFQLLVKVSHVAGVFPGNAKGLPVGDIQIHANRVIVCTQGSLLVPPLHRKIVRTSAVVGSVCFQSLGMSNAVGSRVSIDQDGLYFHEDLHIKPITCMVMSRNGDMLVTGSVDTSVRIWTVQKSQTQRKLSHLCTFVGHTGVVNCLDISLEHSVIISGGGDEQVIVWDFRAKKMIRCLFDHKGPVISVSMNPISGNIATLTANQIRIYSINGVLICYENVVNPSRGVSLTPPTVILAVPCSDWQQRGAIIITGHQGGCVYFWKLKNISSVTSPRKNDRKPSENSTYLVDNLANDFATDGISLKMIGSNSSKSLKSGASPIPRQDKEQSYSNLGNYRMTQVNSTSYNKRQLYPISHNITRTHAADITALKFCGYNTAKNTNYIVSKSLEEYRSTDLVVGDAKGYVSRWTPLRLDQLPSQVDLQNILMIVTLCFIALLPTLLLSFQLNTNRFLTKIALESKTLVDEDKLEVENYFNNEGFNRWNKIYSNSDEVNKVQLDIRTGHQQTIDKVLNWFASEDNSKKVVCDAGCGVGSLALPMTKKFQKVFASDIAASMTKEANARAKDEKIKNVEFKVSDLETLQGKYDTVTCIDVMIHYPTDKMYEIVDKLGSLSKERLIISFAPKNIFYDLLKKVGELFPGKSKTTRAYLHPEDDVIKALTLAGFQIKRKEMTSTNFYFSRLLEAVKKN